MASKRRRFGSVRKLASGRWQARYPGPDGQERKAPETFERKGDAERYLSLVEAQITRREWLDPERAKVLLAFYGARWIFERPRLSHRTRDYYESLFENHILPFLGEISLGQLDTPLVRQWRAGMISNGVSENNAAKAYRLLRAILNTSVKEDKILPANPCCIPGADKENWSERPALTMAQVFALVDEVPDRFRALVLVAAVASLRYGEVTALERQDMDLTSRTVRVRQAFTRVKGKGLVLGPPKSRAGRRVVPLPTSAIPELRRHLAGYVGSDPAARVFTGPKGAALQRSNFNKLIGWKKAVANIGMPGLHLHDLRHTGNTLAASSRASTRDLMDRMGHDSVRAALIYQHATSEAGQRMAAAIDNQMRAARPTAKKRGVKSKRKRSERNPDDPEAGALVPVA